MFDIENLKNVEKDGACFFSNTYYRKYIYTKTVFYSTSLKIKIKLLQFYVIKY